MQQPGLDTSPLLRMLKSYDTTSSLWGSYIFRYCPGIRRAWPSCFLLEGSEEPMFLSQQVSQ